MKFTVQAPPNPSKTGDHDLSFKYLAGWAYRAIRDIGYILNGRMLPTDQFDAEESEITVAVADATQVVSHTLDRVPTRVEAVRADAKGVVYTTAMTSTAVTVTASVAGNYRIRVS